MQQELPEYFCYFEGFLNLYISEIQILKQQQQQQPTMDFSNSFCSLRNTIVITKTSSGYQIKSFFFIVKEHPQLSGTPCIFTAY